MTKMCREKWSSVNNVGHKSPSILAISCRFYAVASQIAQLVQKAEGLQLYYCKIHGEKMIVYSYLNINDPWIAWLVYRGELVSANQANAQAISVWHARQLLSNAQAARISRYTKELAIDSVRQENFPTAISRLRGLYVFPDRCTAESISTRWDGQFSPDLLAEINLRDGVRLSRYDSDWITFDFQKQEESWATSYFSGIQRSSNPVWELLVEGRAVVLGTEIRERAYEVVKRTWPQSLGLLELSRVAVEVGSDLGLIAPVVWLDRDILHMRLMINFEDANCEQFLARLRNFKGARNTRDLKATTELCTPDLTSWNLDSPLIG